MLANTTNIINTALATGNELVKELLANKNGEFFRISTVHHGWAKKAVTPAKFAEMVNSGDNIEVIDGEVSIDNFLDKYDNTIKVRIGTKDLEIRRISLEVKPKEEEKLAHRPKYKAYKEDSVETTGIGPATAAALGRELQDGEIVNELISIQFDNRSYIDSLWNLKIRMLENPNGFIWISKKGELYITDGSDSAYKLFVADTWNGKVVKPQKANRTGRPGGYAKAVPAKNQMVPTFYRPAGRNGGTYMFISRNLRDEYETRLSGYTFAMLVKMAKDQKAGYAKFVKMMKYQDIVGGAKKEFNALDLNKYRIAIVNAKNHPDGLPLFGDGNFSAHIPGLRDRKAYQGRFNDFGKGIMKNNKADFDHDMKMVETLGLPVKYIGNPDGEVIAIMDLNVYKFESNRPEGFGKNWLMKECVAGRMAQTHLKQLVRFAYHGINIDPCFDAWENALADKVEECFIPQPNSGYALSMLQGIESGATRAAVNKVLVNAMKDVTIELGGNVITITQNRRFNNKPSVTYENGHKVYIVYANRKTCKHGTYLELRYPSTGLFEMVYVRVVNDDSVCDGCICCAVNEDIQEMLEILGGADADGDEIHLYPLTVDGKNTWLYDELNRIGYKPEKIHNIMPSVARKLIPAHAGQFVADAILEGANQAGLVIGSANEILYAPLEAKMDIMCNTGKEFSEYTEQFAEAEEMSTEDIRSWIKYVSSKNFCVYSVSAEEMAKSFDRDLMRVASWCAEVATGIASNGTGVPADIMWFFKDSKYTVNDSAYNKNLASPYVWIEGKINESIGHAREYASERIKQIDFCNKKFRKEWIKSNSADYINGRMKAPEKDEKGRVNRKTQSNSLWLKEEIEAVKAAASIADAKLFNVWEYVESYINSLDIIHANLLRSFLWGECGVGSHCFTREMMTEVGYTGLENLPEEAVRTSYTGTDKTYVRCYVKEASGLVDILNDDTMSIKININNGQIKKMAISDAVGSSNEITINGKSDVISGSSCFTRNANGEYAVDRAFVLEKARNADQYMVIMCLKHI
jgi:hypothetical protein